MGFKKNIEDAKPQKICEYTRFEFYNEEEKYLVYLGYIKIEKAKYSIYMDRETKELYIYKIKVKRKRNKLYYIENDEEFQMVKEEVLSILGVSK